MILLMMMVEVTEILFDFSRALTKLWNSTWSYLTSRCLFMWCLTKPILWPYHLLAMPSFTLLQAILYSAPGHPLLCSRPSFTLLQAILYSAPGHPLLCSRPSFTLLQAILYSAPGHPLLCSRPSFTLLWAGHPFPLKESSSVTSESRRHTVLWE